MCNATIRKARFHAFVTASTTNGMVRIAPTSTNALLSLRHMTATLRRSVSILCTHLLPLIANARARRDTPNFQMAHVPALAVCVQRMLFAQATKRARATRATRETAFRAQTSTNARSRLAFAARPLAKICLARMHAFAQRATS